MTALRNDLIREIHVLKRQHGLDDETYRAKLRTATGQESCKAMTLGELKRARASFAPAAKPRPMPNGNARMAQALWISLYNLGAVHDRRDTALDAFVRGRKDVEAARWLTDAAAARKVIEALKSWCEREGVDWKGGGALPARAVAVAQWNKLHGGAGDWFALIDFGRNAIGGDLRDWNNAAWAAISRALGHRVRKHLKDRRTA